MGGSPSCQPPTYSYYDFSGVPAGSGARVYSYACYSEVSITGTSEGLLEWDGKITALASQIAGSTPPVIISPVMPQPSWVSTVALAGSGTLNTASWKLTLTRKVAPKFTDQGTQDPFAIPRGYAEASLAFDFDPLSDELQLIDYYANTQPACSIVAGNNLPGTQAASLTITANQLGFTDGALEDGKDVFAASETAKLVANTVNAGPSGGYSPLVVTLANAIVNY